MPIHDWTRIPAGMFHDFHHAWIEEIKRALNKGVLPAGYYAAAHQVAAGVGPDVLTLQEGGEDNGEVFAIPDTGGGGTAVLALPQIQLTSEVDRSQIPRKSSTVAVRHVSNNRLIAVVEIVSPANKTRHGLPAFLVKAADLLNDRIHLLILDLHPPSTHDLQGMHGALWDHLADAEYALPRDRPLTLAAYESAEKIRAFVEHRRVGETLPDMPLYLAPGRFVNVPLEATYQRAFEAFPPPWQRLLEAPG